LNKYTPAELTKLAKQGAIECFYKGTPPPPTLPESPEEEPGTGDTLEADTPNQPGNRREELYKTLIAQYHTTGQSVLITVPDGLTASFLEEKLDSVDVYSSDKTPKEREALWTDYAHRGKTGVIVGGLSAALLPIKNLGLIICDRAGSFTYKRTFFSKYHINLLAQLRAHHSNIPIVEPDTPHPLHTLQAPQTSQPPETTETTESASAPKAPVTSAPPVIPPLHAEVHMIKGHTKGIPGDFIELLKNYYFENRKILIVLNKKKGTAFLFCGKCKKIEMCPACSGFLNVEDESKITCTRCGLEKETHTVCSKCNDNLVMMEDISISSVKKIIKSQVVETGLMSFSAEGLKDDHVHHILQKIAANRIVIATPVILNPYFRGMFDAVIYMRPESYFNMDEYDAAEKIYSIVSELRELVKEEGCLDIFSTFHFHYALKLINDAERFFQRELKYRQWFMLPPFANIYHIEVKGKDLRKLAKEMRGIYKKHKDSLNIKKSYLTSRKKMRGNFKGIMEAHAKPEEVLESGLIGKRNIVIDLILN
ncbi:MAG: hypothetical protein GY757_13890, partial [bacterium]|nr:hypothetical protein [bacterium]